MKRVVCFSYHKLFSSSIDLPFLLYSKSFRTLLGKTLSFIAQTIEVDKSTVSREVKRNRSKQGYSFQKAQMYTQERMETASEQIFSLNEVSGFFLDP